MTFLVNYTETFTGQVIVSAQSEEDAIKIVRQKIDNEDLVPSESFDGHEVTVDFAKEVKDA